MINAEAYELAIKINAQWRIVEKSLRETIEKQSATGDIEKAVLAARQGFFERKWKKLTGQDMPRLLLAQYAQLFEEL